MEEKKTPVEKKTTTSATPKTTTTTAKTTKSTTTKATAPKTASSTATKASASTSTTATVTKTTASKTASSTSSAKSTSAPATKAPAVAPKTSTQTAPIAPKAMPSAVAPKAVKSTSTTEPKSTVAQTASAPKSDAKSTASAQKSDTATTSQSQTTKSTPPASAGATSKVPEPASADPVHKSAGNPNIEDIKVGGIMVDQDVLSKSHIQRSEKRKKTVITILIALIIASWVGIGFIVLNYLNAIKPAKGRVFIRWDGEYYDQHIDTPMKIYQRASDGTMEEIPSSWEMPKNIQSGSIYHLNLYIENTSTTDDIVFRVKLTISFNGVGENGTVEGNAAILYAIRKEDDDGSGYYEWKDGYLVYKNTTNTDALAPGAQVKLCGDLSLNNDIKDINCDNLNITITIEAYSAPHTWDV